MSFIKGSSDVYRHRITRKLYRLSGNFIAGCYIMQEIREGDLSGRMIICSPLKKFLLYSRQDNLLCPIQGPLVEYEG